MGAKSKTETKPTNKTFQTLQHTHGSTDSSVKRGDKGKFPIGKGYNSFGSVRVKESVMRKNYIGDFVEEMDHLENDKAIRLEKLYDGKHECQKNETVSVGKESFVLKVARSRHFPSPQKLKEMFCNERTFDSRFRAKLKSLPLTHEQKNPHKFKAFFNKYR